MELLGAELHLYVTSGQNTYVATVDPRMDVGPAMRLIWCWIWMLPICSIKRQNAPSASYLIKDRKAAALGAAAFFFVRDYANAHYEIGENFPLQFAWRLPEGDYIRAVFQAEVLDLVPEADKYVVQLNQLAAGRQENEEGELRSQEAYSSEYWSLVDGLVGRKITIAYEADDSRAVHMRLATLTGEHNFFTRYEDAEVIAQGLLAAARRRAQEEECPKRD